MKLQTVLNKLAVALLWSMLCGAAPGFVEVMDDLRNYSDTPLDWRHITALFLSGFATGAVTFYRKERATIKAILAAELNYKEDNDAV